MKLWQGLAVAGIMVSLAACGETTGDRALSGAAIGAGSGAAIGAGVGAATGAVTSPNQIDLGRPVWEH